MSLHLSQDEQVRGLVAMGVPREKAERTVRGEIAEVARVLVSKAFPIAFALPWSALTSENRRFCARGSRIVMTAEYKAARDRARGIAREVMHGAPAFAEPLALVARVWMPDKRIHDAPNFAGAVHNAFKGVIYTDDRWLYDARWIRAGVDVDRPRAEIEVRPL